MTSSATPLHMVNYYIGEKTRHTSMQRLLPENALHYKKHIAQLIVNHRVQNGR